MAKYAKQKTASRPKRQGRKSAPKPKRILNCLPSPKQEDDWSFETARAAVAWTYGMTEQQYRNLVRRT